MPCSECSVKYNEAMSKKLTLLLTFFITLAYSKPNEETITVPALTKQQDIINKAIAFHGLEGLGNASFDLTFRGIDYTYSNKSGIYTYTRTQKDSINRTVYDHMNNERLVRLIDGDTAEITDEKRAAYTRSVNSVIYFFRLPFGLNDPAVNKKYIGEKEIKGKTYHEIEITFGEEGGGEDFDDVFLYWFDTEDYSMDYLAYLYHTDGGGIRFREAINPRRVSGALVQDYINLKPEDESIQISTILDLYKSDQLIELSRIINEDIGLQFN